MCLGYKSNTPRPSTASDVSAGSTKTIVNNRYQKYICNCTNKPSFPSRGGLCSHPLTQRPDTPRPMMLKEQDKSKPKVTWHNICAPLAHLSSADATCIQCATTIQIPVYQLHTIRAHTRYHANRSILGYYEKRFRTQTDTRCNPCNPCSPPTQLA